MRHNSSILRRFVESQYSTIWLGFVGLSFVALLTDAGWSESTVKSNVENYETTYSVEYMSFEDATRDNGKRSLLADLYLPKGEGPFPTVLMVHGGAWFSGNKAHVALHARAVAKAGYSVMAVNYRLAPRFKFPAQLDDLRSALQFIKDNAKQYKFDANRIGAYGYSAGGHLVSLLGVTQNEADENQIAGAEVKVIVAGGSPCEFSWIADNSERLAFWLGGSRNDKPEAYANASPITFVDKADPAFFFFHGQSDGIVPIESSQEMNRLLQGKGVRTEFHSVHRGSHLGAFTNPKARSLAIAFLDKHLKATAEIGSTTELETGKRNQTGSKLVK